MDKCEKCYHGDRKDHDFKCRPVDCTEALEAYHEEIGRALVLYAGSKQAQEDVLEALEENLEFLMHAFKDMKEAAEIAEKATEELRCTGCDNTCRMNSFECKKLAGKAANLYQLQIKALLLSIKELKDSICALNKAVKLAESFEDAAQEYNECAHFPCSPECDHR